MEDANGFGIENELISNDVYGKFETKNFLKIFEKLDEKEKIYKINKQEINNLKNSILNLEKAAMNGDDYIQRNRGNVSLDLRNFLEPFLESFITSKEDFFQHSNKFEDYMNNETTFKKIMFLRNKVHFDLELVDELLYISKRTNENAHSIRGEIKLNRVILDTCLYYISIILSNFLDIKTISFFPSKYEKNYDERMKINDTFNTNEPFKQINIKESAMLNLLFDSSFKFYIPTYQRKYSWGEAEIDDLFSDIEKVSLKDNEDHFFGSITLGKVNIENSDLKIDVSRKTKIYKIVDGQQRFTTVILIVHALYDSYLGNAKYNEDIVSKQLGKLKSFLTNRNLPIERFDDEQTKSIFSSIWSGNFKKNIFSSFKENNLLKVYNYILKKMKNLSNDQLDILYKGLRRLIVGINWIGDYNEFELFESINSKGKPLTNFDLFKSYLISIINNKFEEENTNYVSSLFVSYIFENKLNKIKSKDFEKITDEFLKSYITYYDEGVKFNKNRLFLKFKEIFNKELNKKFSKNYDFSIEEFKEILFDLAVFLSAFLITKSGENVFWKENKELHNYYKNFFIIDSTAFSPLILSYLIDEQNIEFTEFGDLLNFKFEKEFEKMLTLIESWKIKIEIANHQDNFEIYIPNFIKRFNMNFKEKRKFNSHYSLLLSAINNETDILKLPNDDEILLKLISFPIFNQKTLRNIILKIVEHHHGDDLIDVYNLKIYDIYSLIEKSETKRSDAFNKYLRNFRDVGEINLSKMGNYFLYKRDLKVKKSDNNDYFKILNSLTNDNVTINRENIYKITSLASLDEFRSKSISEFIDSRSKFYAEEIIKILNI